MKTPALLVVALLSASTTTPEVRSPQIPNYIEISGQRLHLGMTKAQVSEKLAGKTVQIMKDDLWTIGVNFPPEAEIQFTNGKLTYAEREWPSASNDLFESLYGAISTLNEQGFKGCVVTSYASNDPGLILKNIWVDCAGKSVSINRVTLRGNTYTFIQESLGDRR